MKPQFTPSALEAAASGDLENFIAAVTPGGIEAQERAGQATFVSSTTLPKDMEFTSPLESLKQMGITLGAEVDDLFVEAQLPDGWQKRATDHATWSELLDEKGRKRASIFYKAAFYDRSAHMGLCLRYVMDCYAPHDADGGYATVIKDGGTIIHVVGVRKDRDYRLGEEHYNQAVAWLDSHYPDWRNPLAYWECSRSAVPDQPS